MEKSHSIDRSDLELPIWLQTHSLLGHNDWA